MGKAQSKAKPARVSAELEAGIPEVSGKSSFATPSQQRMGQHGGAIEVWDTASPASPAGSITRTVKRILRSKSHKAETMSIENESALPATTPKEVDKVEVWIQPDSQTERAKTSKLSRLQSKSLGMFSTGTQVESHSPAAASEPSSARRAADSATNHTNPSGGGVSASADFHNKLPVHLRAVTVQWLVAWTNENDCWDMSTRDVVTNVVLPMTASKGRCAVVMLPCVREKRVTGHVDVFMSHTWAGRWGTMVSAAAHNSRPDRLVWVDVLALRQWERDAEGKAIREGWNFCLLTKKVIAQSKGVMFVSEIQDEIVNLDFDKASALDFDASRIFSTGVWEKVAFSRLWCLMEMVSASAFRVPIIIKVGYVDALGQFIEAEAREMLQNVFLVVDIVNATTSKTEDFSVILKALVEMVPSSEELDSLEICNDLIKVNITMGLMWLNEHVLHMAALGELQMLKYLKEERKLDSMLLHPAAAAGVLAPLAEILADNPIIDVDIADEKGYTATMKAAVWGHLKVVRLLVHHGADLSKTNSEGVTALMMARAGKHDALAHWIECRMANPSLPKENLKDILTIVKPATQQLTGSRSVASLTHADKTKLRKDRGTNIQRAKQVPAASSHEPVIEVDIDM